jgi:hypothetical protein
MPWETEPETGPEVRALLIKLEARQALQQLVAAGLLEPIPGPPGEDPVKYRLTELGRRTEPDQVEDLVRRASAARAAHTRTMTKTPDKLEGEFAEAWRALENLRRTLEERDVTSADETVVFEMMVMLKHVGVRQRIKIARSRSRRA